MNPPPALRSVLVTGAAGFIGSTLVQRLLRDGTQVVGLDSLERGHADSLPPQVPLIVGDVRDPDAVRAALQHFGRPPVACIHLASLILVGESVSQPAWYHDVNAVGTQVVTDACLDAGVGAIVLASSAAVLGSEQGGAARLDEGARIGPESPYGASKVAAEETIAAAAQTGRMAAVALRLFNVAGAAHGCTERHDPESHLIPLAIRAAARQIPPLRVFGTDLGTPDGTCLRDYVHIEDVTEAMVRAAARALGQHGSGDAAFDVFHVGSGRGSSVLEVIAAVRAELGVDVPTIDDPPRAGDVPVLVSDPRRLAGVLGIVPDTDLRRMVRDCARQFGLLPG